MDAVIQDAPAESSPATTTADPSQATSQPEQPNGGQTPYRGFHEHPDWQRMVAERRQERQVIAQLREQLGEFQKSQQPKQPSEEDAAREALYKLAPGLTKIEQIEQALQRLNQANFVTTGNGMVEKFAQTHGIASQQIYGAFQHLFGDDPELMGRIKQGDVGLVARALKFIEPIAEALKAKSTDAQRAAAVTLTDKKNAAALIPTPARSGGPPGPAAPVKVTAANESEVRSGMRERLRSMLMSGAQE